jgi:hypothetical protein
MYTIRVETTASGYDIFKDGMLVATPKNERELELQLNFYGILEDICEEFLQRVRETGNASEEMPFVKFWQVS